MFECTVGWGASSLQVSMFASFMSTAFRLVAFASKAEMINVLREKAVVAKHRGADAGDKDSEKPTESEKPAESENAEQAEKSDGELQEDGEEEPEQDDDVVEAGDAGVSGSIFDDSEKDVD